MKINKFVQTRETTLYVCDVTLFVTAHTPMLRYSLITLSVTT